MLEKHRLPWRVPILLQEIARGDTLDTDLLRYLLQLPLREEEYDGAGQHKEEKAEDEEEEAREEGVHRILQKTFQKS